jgi:ferredoxin
MVQNKTPYKKLTVYFFSGTGNAQFAAQSIASKAQKAGIPSEVINISKNKNQPADSHKMNELVGFCYPTHGFNAPPAMINFAFNFPQGSADIFVLNTRAGLKLSKIHVPGIGGAALWIIALILFIKGYKPRGFRPLDLPSNWISLHPGIRNQVKDSIISHCTKTLEKFTNLMLQKKVVLNGLLWLPIDIALLPISLGYYIFGRFALAKTFFANYNCNNCGLCIKDCPVDAIKEISGRPYWGFSCESCMKCMNHCPQRAIETAHGFTALLWWLIFSVIPPFIFILLIDLQLINAAMIDRHYGLIYDLIWLILGLPLIFFSYRILHFLLGFKTFNKLITWTSLTHWKFWRRYRFEKENRS